MKILDFITTFTSIRIQFSEFHYYKQLRVP